MSKRWKEVQGMEVEQSGTLVRGSWRAVLKVLGPVFIALHIRNGLALRRLEVYL